MSDDLFEFLAAQETGRAAEVARRATEEPSFPPKCGQSSTPDWMRDLRFGVSATQTISPISTWTSRCGRVLFVGFGPIVQKAQIW